MALLECEYTRITEGTSGLVCSGSGYLVGLLVGHDYAADPVISLYDNIVAAGDEVIPTVKVDASAFGFNGFMPGTIAIPFNIGLFLNLTTGGTAEIFVYYRLDGPTLPSKMIR